MKQEETFCPLVAVAYRNGYAHKETSCRGEQCMMSQLVSTTTKENGKEKRYQCGLVPHSTATFTIFSPLFTTQKEQTKKTMKKPVKKTLIINLLKHES